MFASNVFASGPVYFFYGTGCAHCALVDQYFEENNYYEKYQIEKFDIYTDPEASQFFMEKLSELGADINRLAVPTVIVGDKYLVGDKPIITNFLDLTGDDSEPATEDFMEEVDIPKFELTLPLVVGASLVDAINPCAFAVLIILVSTIIAKQNAKKALYSGLSFSVSVFISYLLMGLGLFKVIQITGGFSNQILKIVGVLAIVLGLFNLKDYLWYGKLFVMEVPFSWRPKLKEILKSVTNPVGAFMIGFIVSLFLLPCTSGPYVVILSLLASRTQVIQALSYLVLYNLIFVSPMILITVLVYRGMDPNKAEKVRVKRLKTLHLIAGLVLLVMGLLIVGGVV